MKTWGKRLLVAVVGFLAAGLLGCGASQEARGTLEPVATTVPFSEYLGLPQPSPTFNPTGPTRNCSDFTDWGDAQGFYETARRAGMNQHILDVDRDGIACEPLLLAQWRGTWYALDEAIEARALTEQALSERSDYQLDSFRDTYDRDRY